MSNQEKFERDLAVGEKAEKWVMEEYLGAKFTSVEKMKGFFKDYDLIAKNDFVTVTFEVKREEYNLHHNSNNICIEYEYNGKASGIKYTKADVWIHIYYDNYKKSWSMLVVRTDSLRWWIMLHINEIKNKPGGDDKKTMNFVIPIKLLTASRFKIIDLNKMMGSVD